MKTILYLLKDKVMGDVMVEPRTSQARISSLCQEKDPKDPRVELVTEVE